MHIGGLRNKWVHFYKKELGFELDIACVIGREGKDIPADEAATYIAGSIIMNNWSARDFQRQDMQLGLGPSKGKDFATSLGPWLVTPDELATHRTGNGSCDRYDMTMTARINGQEISRGNFNQIYYTFPQMIAYASRNNSLRPSDIIDSGCLLELGSKVNSWLQPCQTVELEIEGIGVLSQSIFLTNRTNH
jgi:fumarylacetoacetate (FAA) hydrolase